MKPPGRPVAAFDSGGSTSDPDKAKKRYDSNIFRRMFGTPGKDWFGGSSGSPTAPGGVPSTSSADDAMGPPQPAPAGWQGLGDQSREAAFNPNYDYSDPANRHVVDFQGRVNPQAYQQLMQGQGAGTTTPAYSAPPKPVTQLTSSKALNDKINQMIGLPEEPPPVGNADFNGSGQWPRVPLQAKEQVTAPRTYSMADPYGRRPVMGPPAPPPPSSPSVPAAQAQGTVGGSPFSGRQRNASPTVSGGDLTSWLARARQRLGFDIGGMVPGLPGTGDDYRTSVADTDPFQGLSLGAKGPSHAVIGQAVSAPSPPQPSAAKGGGGGGGFMDTVGKLAPLALAFLARGGAIPRHGPLDDMSGLTVNPYPYGGRQGFRRGGYPEFFNEPPVALRGLPQRTAFSGRGYVAGDGQGDGRSDHIDAALSPGEYVMDAETTSLLGDGDNEAGARKFEQLRQNIRKHKGQQLAKGKFSPKAKAPESYLSPKLSAADRLAHSRVSDGLRGRR